MALRTKQSIHVAPIIKLGIFGMTLVSASLLLENISQTHASAPSKTEVLSRAGSTPLRQSEKETSTVKKETTTSTSTNKTPTSTPVSKTATPSAGVTVANTVQVNDQFSGTALDPAFWQAMTYAKGIRNNEEQDYTPSQVRVADGTLQITASKDASGQWHSGEVHSKWNYTYGDFEVRLALSATGNGVWPAAWLMGVNGQWPNNGEIDMFENVNGAPYAYGTIHGGGSNGMWQLQGVASSINILQYHTYTIKKHPGIISWWVDGVKLGEWTKDQTPAGGTWPFEATTNFALLNLAIGGTWPGPSDATTPDPITMYVDSYTVKNAS